MKRDEMLDRVTSRAGAWDIVIIGGGATGVGVAVDAASRGYDVLLLEQSDFGKGTSSRSTKLVHGGVRYLEQGNVSLVMEALKERGLLRRNAPHLVHDLAFVVPTYEWWESPFYGIGLKVYNLLSGRYGFGPSTLLSRDETLERLPTIKTDGLRGGVVYHDGQFDDARLLINLVATAAEQGAVLLNYAAVRRLTRGGDGFISGVVFEDVETGRTVDVSARVVINATGAWVDAIRRLARPGAPPMIAPSQGIHLVFDGSFLFGDSAIMVPHTPDGRVMFAIPWHGHTLVGTTDTPIDEVPLEPLPQDQEVDFLLTTAAMYLETPPTRNDILSAFAGIRPLISARDTTSTAALSREHSIHIDDSGLLTIAGGKWTTYRHMAEDCVDQAATLGRLPERACVTRELNIHGFLAHPGKHGSLAVYGSDAPGIEALVRSDAQLAAPLHPALPYLLAEVVWAVRQEMARTIDDVLARRTRALVLNARAAIDAAPRVAAVMAAELGRDAAWQEQQLADFRKLAAGYLVTSAKSA
jgi:glycerol-3-phosphate dehydrogenase